MFAAGEFVASFAASWKIVPRRTITGRGFATGKFVSSRGYAKLRFDSQHNPWRNLFQRHGQQQQRCYSPSQPNQRQAFNYRRFQASSSLLRRWAARPTAYYEAGAAGIVVAGFVVFNTEHVPVSHRRRFNIISPEYEASQGESLYKQTMQEYQQQILPANHPKHRMVQRVLDRLIPHSGLDGERWEVHVIDSPEKNAFVIPGGKVFVFSGIMDVCRGDDGMAAVLGHEIAHNVAHHSAERLSRVIPLLVLAYLGSFALGIDAGFGSTIVDLAFLRPGSRSQESEADYIGLLMMAESCYDPEAAAALWARMEKEEHAAPPQFLSTHPSNHNRLQKIGEWMDEAKAKQQDAECHGTAVFGEFCSPS
ncbi:hypothetical protein MBLNU230_g8011t1 [Neophaeotheca triangularis]